MNIQLRDSKPLQDAIKKQAGKNQLPKAQLHPELLAGIVECDREGFEIRSEILFGDNRGEPNAQDALNLSAFLSAGPVKCKAAWKNVAVKQGESMVNIPSELVFTFEDQSKLAVHTQAVSDVTKLTGALPSDQSAEFDATPGTGTISFVRAGRAVVRADSSPAVIGELKTQAAILGVTWDKDASLETMVQRMNEAREAKKKPQKKEPVAV